jgi:UDPglucose 6-dehydrogenase
VPKIVTVIGLGYLGTTHAVAMAEFGHTVIGIEPDESKLRAFREKKLPFYEPGLENALSKAVDSGKLTFQAAHEETSRTAHAHFICVGTPQSEGTYAANTTYVYASGLELASWMSPDSVVIGKSTVPVGTAAELKKQMGEIAGFDVDLIWNPEFLREGTALEDSLHPDRVVVGGGTAKGIATLKEIYAPIVNAGTPFVEMDLQTAELVKTAANSFLATKISFINAMAEIAEVSGADTVKLAEAIGLDERIGKHFLKTGIGFGGGCFPKDIRAFISRAEELGVGEALAFLRDVDAVNLRRRQRVVDLLNKELGTVAEKKIFVLGAAFKPNSDDLRDSPALAVATKLKALGANVFVHDPKAGDHVKALLPELNVVANLAEGFSMANAVVLATEWDEYKQIDPEVSGTLMAQKVVVDGRNVLDVEKWRNAGWTIYALGRSVANEVGGK